MGRWLLEYELEAHLTLCDGTSTLRYSPENADIEITVAHPKSGLVVDESRLAAYVVLHAQTPEAARERAEAALRQFVDTLSLVTSSTFSVLVLVRIVDWTLGLAERLCWQYKGVADFDVPIRALDGELIESVQIVESADLPLRLRRAIKWFGAAVRSRYLDDQFQYFWFVLEMLAQVDKDTAPVADLCAKCRGELVCPACNSPSTHKPYPKESIRQLFHKRMSGEVAEGFFRIACRVRNKLLDGNTVTEIEQSLPLPFAKLTNDLGGLARVAILACLQGQLPEKKIHLLEANQLVPHTLTIGVQMIVGRDMDSNAPDWNLLPTLNIGLSKRNTLEGTNSGRS